MAATLPDPDGRIHPTANPNPSVPVSSESPRRTRWAAALASAAAVTPPPRPGRVDCFSHLNEDLLRSVLSRIPTRSAVTLAAVSRHFRKEIPRLLERVASLTLHEPHAQPPLRVTPPLILRRLALAPHRAIPPSSFRPVLDDAAQHGLSELAFRLTRRARQPKSVLSVKSIAVLDLDTCAVPPWSQVACPCLRTLRLHRVAIGQEIINKILASASCLDTLEMVYCTGLSTGRGGGCTVESSSVRNLVFRPTLNLAQTTIRASALRTVTLYTRGKVKSLELAPAPEVRKAYLHIAKLRTTKESLRVRPFLDAGVRLECLTLRGHAMKVLSSEYEDIPELTGMFQDLRILSVSLDLSSAQETVFLLKLLESCPNLQKFSLSAAGSLTCLPFTDHKEKLASISCLTTSLVEFKFLGFRPQQYQKELMVFLLTQRKMLKKVEVEFKKCQADAVKKILSVKRAPIENISSKNGSHYMVLDYS
ncbi:hypothetical protein PVAP13_5NG499800 [Panicum virgatum]|uniref:F-box domain-containing protein n=1 Tax=Panicum virgatum TaxID=38727 RepID=A0A8T0S0E7_PANVG|nr:hypothetical protein PVAP13_5NG499800 [Panicum virgatum]KAG2591668.1 hypothetical protein PVAP13_5NG499800 [Panicum virgatum]